MKPSIRFANFEAQLAAEDPNFKDFLEKLTPKKLISLRKHLNLTQEAVAKNLGIPRAHIIGAESGAEPIPAGLVVFYAVFTKKIETPWGQDVAKMSFSFVDKADVFSEWVDRKRPDLRYYIAQTFAKLTLDSANSEQDIHFDIYCSNRETAESTGDCPQTVAQAEAILTKKGFIKVATFIKLTEKKANEEREGAELDLHATLSKIEMALSK